MAVNIPTRPLDDGDYELLRVAGELLERKFRDGVHHVAAAVRLPDGQIVTGLHIGSRRINICAEQIALGRAIIEHGVTPVACASVIMMTEDDTPQPTSPCGVCRELVGFHNPDMSVVITIGNQLSVALFRDLLPAPWLLPEELSSE